MLCSHFWVHLKAMCDCGILGGNLTRWKKAWIRQLSFPLSNDVSMCIQSHWFVLPLLFCLPSPASDPSSVQEFHNSTIDSHIYETIALCVCDKCDWCVLPVLLPTFVVLSPHPSCLKNPPIRQWLWTASCLMVNESRERATVLIRPTLPYCCLRSKKKSGVDDSILIILCNACTEFKGHFRSNSR